MHVLGFAADVPHALSLSRRLALSLKVGEDRFRPLSNNFSFNEAIHALQAHQQSNEIGSE